MEPRTCSLSPLCQQEAFNLKFGWLALSRSFSLALLVLLFQSPFFALAFSFLSLKVERRGVWVGAIPGYFMYRFRHALLRTILTHRAKYYAFDSKQFMLFMPPSLYLKLQALWPQPRQGHETCILCVPVTSSFQSPVKQAKPPIRREAISSAEALFASVPPTLNSRASPNGPPKCLKVSEVLQLKTGLLKSHQIAINPMQAAPRE